MFLVADIRQPKGTELQVIIAALVVAKRELAMLDLVSHVAAE